MASGGLGGRRGRGERGGLGGTAQDRPVVWIAQPHDALVADVNSVESLHAEEGPVGAAEVLKDPGVPVQPQHPVMPRNTGVGHHDVRVRVPADTVSGPGLELMNRAPRPHHEVGHGPRTRAGRPGRRWRRGGNGRRGMQRRSLGEPGWRESGLGRTRLWRLPVRPVKMLGWHAYKV